MKLYQQFKKIVEAIKPVEVAWFTTFNLDVELVERFLLPRLVDTEPSELKTAEDYEALNLALKEINIKVWFDYRALNLNSPKRTTMDFISIDPRTFYDSSSADIVFHPKVVFLKGKGGAYLICGSANLSIGAWSSNKEGVLIKEITTRENATEVITFFENLYDIGGADKADLENLRQWRNKLSKETSGWNFYTSLNNSPNLFERLGTGSLTTWSPYFSKDATGLVQKLLKAGYSKITLVPDIASSGKVRITPTELKALQQQESVAIYRHKETQETSNDRAHITHAKVWLTEDKLAVGSWNFTKPGTGLTVPVTERNVEAGIITSISKSTYNALLGSIAPIHSNLISGTSASEMEEEWAQMLNPFTMDCKVIANWEKFTYDIVSDELEGLSVLLPDRPNEKVPLAEVTDRSFRENYKKVLKDKTFTVYNFEDKPVFSGFLIETGTHKRPAYGYATLFDLFDSLLDNPSGETSRKVCQYSLLDEEDEQYQVERPVILYQGNDSYYMMFVAFQKLYDAIDQNQKNQKKLDEIGFRLPGSLIKTSDLVKESLSALDAEMNEDRCIYFYFLACELNRCITLFNTLTEQQIPAIEADYLFSRLNPSDTDTGFLKKLKDEFGYTHA